MCSSCRRATTTGSQSAVAQILKVRPNQVALQAAEESLYTESSLSTDSVHASRAWLEPLPPRPSRGCTCVAPGTHPGGGIPGAAGRNAAREIL